MNEAVAALMIRMYLALADEGIGPRNPESGDVELLWEAVRVAGHLFDRHELWDIGLISDEDHARDDCGKAGIHQQVYEMGRADVEPPVPDR